MRLKNRYFLLRHGEALSNQKDIISSLPEKIYNPLTKKGEKDVKKALKKLKSKKIDLIFCSRLLRAKQTAKIISEGLKKKVFYDKRLDEIDAGVLNGKKVSEYINFFKGKDRFKIGPLKGESYGDVEKRVFDFFVSLEKKYKDKNILIISHQAPLMLFEERIKMFLGKVSSIKIPKNRIKTAEVREIKN
jgi:broad specificity phosphatase PhoE